MTVKDALAELEDRDLHEVIRLLKSLDSENRRQTEEIATLKAKLDQLQYGGF